MKNQVIDLLLNCIKDCNHCASACLEEDNVNKMVDCINTDQICAAVCEATFKVLQIDHGDQKALLKHCASVCDECADECEKHDHKHCKQCASSCRSCAEACRQLAA